MKVLVGCECSGVVREAFRALGHDAWSCDIESADDNSPYHLRCDLFEVIGQAWDLGIFHPPCTHIAVSGARWFKQKIADGRQQQGIDFFMRVVRESEHIPRVGFENPVCVMSRLWRKPDQIIQPWQYGHGETKTTCLWLRNLPNLTPTHVVDAREHRIHRLPPTIDRAKIRSRTYEGIASAMAAQWGGAV